MTNIDIRMKKEDIKKMDFSFVSSFFWPDEAYLSGRLAVSGSQG